MKITTRALTVAVLLVETCLVVSSCGRPGQHLASRERTRSCLTEAGVHVRGKLDFVATTATGGALKAHLSGDAVTIAFGETVADASSIVDAYRRFHARNVGINDVLAQQGNVVMLWRLHPSTSDLALVIGCLK
jgi:hypothetical protein